MINFVHFIILYLILYWIVCYLCGVCFSCSSKGRLRVVWSGVSRLVIRCRVRRYDLACRRRRCLGWRGFFIKTRRRLRVCRLGGSFMAFIGCIGGFLSCRSMLFDAYNYLDSHYGAFVSIRVTIVWSRKYS